MQLIYYWAYLSFGGNSADDEILVISADCQRDGARFALSCDIARGNGEILLDGPEAAIEPNAAVELRAWTDQVVAFVETNVPQVLRELDDSNGG